MRALIVGGGGAAMMAAWRIRQAGHEVALFESDARLGGNCFGVDVCAEDGSVHRVDAGVSDFNAATFQWSRPKSRVGRSPARGLLPPGSRQSSPPSGSM